MLLGAVVDPVFSLWGLGSPYSPAAVWSPRPFRLARPSRLARPDSDRRAAFASRVWLPVLLPLMRLLLFELLPLFLRPARKLATATPSCGPRRARGISRPRLACGPLRPSAYTSCPSVVAYVIRRSRPLRPCPAHVARSTASRVRPSTPRPVVASLSASSARAAAHSRCMHSATSSLVTSPTAAPSVSFRPGRLGTYGAVVFLW